jgi:hypothetical protein
MIWTNTDGLDFGLCICIFLPWALDELNTGSWIIHGHRREVEKQRWMIKKSKTRLVMLHSLTWMNGFPVPWNEIPKVGNPGLHHYCACRWDLISIGVPRVTQLQKLCNYVKRVCNYKSLGPRMTLGARNIKERNISLLHCLFSQNQRIV